MYKKLEKDDVVPHGDACRVTVDGERGGTRRICCSAGRGYFNDGCRGHPWLYKSHRQRKQYEPEHQKKNRLQNALKIAVKLAFGCGGDANRLRVGFGDVCIAFNLAVRRERDALSDGGLTGNITAGSDVDAAKTHRSFRNPVAFDDNNLTTAQPGTVFNVAIIPHADQGWYACSTKNDAAAANSGAKQAQKYVVKFGVLHERDKPHDWAIDALGLRARADLSGSRSEP
jgi:hypothetical protein